MPVLGISGLNVSVDLGKSDPADKNRDAPNARRARHIKENNATPIHLRLRAGFGSGFGDGSCFCFGSGFGGGSCLGFGSGFGGGSCFGSGSGSVVGSNFGGAGASIGCALTGYGSRMVSACLFMPIER